MTEQLAKAYLIALDGMDRTGPRDLHRRATIEAEDLGATPAPSDEALREYLRESHPDDELRKDLVLWLATWDSAKVEDAAWAEDTEQNTRARRELIVRKLNIDDASATLFTEMFPIADRDGTVVIADSWEAWYTPEVRRKRDFYWAHYTDYLRNQRGWSGHAVIKLDQATTHVVERLNDPARELPDQAKGLVVGYVQSGKTANFTGVIAKAIDAGYRLIIVLTGTTNLLREQTQRRLDMELVGRENILRGVDTSNPEALIDVDYQADRAWVKDQFVRHGCQPADVGRPDIHRMTTHQFDYRSLKQGIVALDFERRDRTKPLTHVENLFTSDARLVVVKKNKGVLQKLVRDLGKITARLHQIPALIIDDESDQASINTSNPKRWEEGKKDRTSINALISQLLGMLPRGQYVGYTATPFANVFVDPSDAQDIFPKNFLLSLEPPPGYMGAQHFHDLESPIAPEDRTFANSNEKAHIRLLKGDDELELSRALDSFVLTGAIKLYREDKGSGSFEHHTMLVHEAMRTRDHRSKADEIKRAWSEAGYLSSASHARLRDLFETDFLPVSRALADDLPTPQSFEHLVPYIGKAVRRMSPNGNPVLVINSDKDIEQEELDFSQHGVWRILVGGNKLARGFTVEGLTVSYYSREVKSADALMQMGRWFGFRHGYRDLVRLHVTPGLRDAFESICRDEDNFRAELSQYAEMVDGRPLVTPAEVPPLVSSHMLRPTAASKMYNAVLVERRTLNKEPSSGYPSLTDESALQHNIDSCVPLLAAAKGREKLSAGGTKFDAYVGTVRHEVMLDVLGKLRWAHEHTFGPDFNWIRGLGRDRITDWNIVIPQQKSGRFAKLRGLGPYSLHGRAVEGDHVRGNSASVHRSALDSLKESGPRTGCMLLYPVVDKEASEQNGGIEIDPSGVVMALRLELPGTATPTDYRPLAYVTRDSTRPLYSVVRG